MTKAQRVTASYMADIRESIDEAHRDDSIKRVIKSDMATYIAFDPSFRRRCIAFDRRASGCFFDQQRARLHLR